MKSLLLYLLVIPFTVLAEDSDFFDQPTPPIQLNEVPEGYLTKNFNLKVLARIPNPDLKNNSNKAAVSATIEKPIAPSKLPKETLATTSYLIETLFLSNPGKYGDRFYDINKDNWKDYVYFQVKLIPQSIDGDKNTEKSTWIYYLSAEGIHGGKEANIAYFTVNDRGVKLSGAQQK